MDLSLLRRKIISFCKIFSISLISKIKILFVKLTVIGVNIDFSSTLMSGCIFSVTDAGSIVIGKNVVIGRFVQIVVRNGSMYIGDDVYIGTGSIIVCIENIQIGNDTLIAEYVTIRDHDHEFSNRPIRKSGFKSSPISIGNDCWIGAKATILKNSVIGQGAVVGAHTLVRGHIPPFVLAVGCPARVVKRG